jgi:exodeoxyribonuclease V beta subunit
LFGDLGKSEVPNIWDYLTGLDSNVFSIEPVLDSVTIINQTTIETELSARKYTGRIKRDWQLSSFSSLVRHHHAPHSVRFNLDDDSANSKSDNMSDTAENLIEDQFSFPKGAHAGNFLHTLLEEVDFTCLPEDMDQQILDKLIIELLTRFGIEEKWLTVTKQWLTVMLTAPLSHSDSGHSDLSLTKLTADLKQVEMEFYFPISKLSSMDFNRLLNQYSVLDCAVNDVDFRTIKGMMKGFIDLTFCWNDQYFILDYKSNHLGHDFSDYEHAKLELAMADHRYDIQLVLYTLALHRLLRLRLSNYDYDQHIGGGYYLFLRGLNLDNNLGQFFHKPERVLIEALDELISAEIKTDPVIEILKTAEHTKNELESGQMGFKL